MTHFTLGGQEVRRRANVSFRVLIEGASPRCSAAARAASELTPALFDRRCSGPLPGPECCCPEPGPEGAAIRLRASWTVAVVKRPSVALTSRQALMCWRSRNAPEVRLQTHTAGFPEQRRGHSKLSTARRTPVKVNRTLWSRLRVSAPTGQLVPKHPRPAHLRLCPARKINCSINIHFTSKEM